MTLSNSQIARVIDIGTNWTRLRIGWRWQLDDPGGTLAGTSSLWIGLLANPTTNMSNGPLGVTTSHFLGMANLAGGPFTRNTVPSVYYNVSSMTPVKRVTATNTTNAFGGGSNLMGARPTVARQIVLLEITKGSPNFTVQAALAQNAGASSLDDMSLGVLISSLEQNTMANAVSVINAAQGANAATITTAPTIAVNEATDGFLNSICFAWTRTAPLLYISDIVYSKLA